MTFVSDRQKGLLAYRQLFSLNLRVDIVSDIFTRTCGRNLSIRHLRHLFLWDAVQATAEEDFHAALSGIEGISKKGLEWLLSKLR